MGHELIISGGTIVDGSGAAPYRADVAVDSGRITRIGDLAGVDATRRIDATGKVVTPGFVDLHTHLDAQVGWDPEMRSSSWHGVTTALIGNCGVTFAPVSPGNRRYLAELMEAVEDIAADAIMDGLPWTWTSYGQYLDAVQGLRPALNIVGLAGHSSIRFEAMGDRSLDEGAQATDAELAHIARLVRESVEGGAVGFSTSRFLGHKVPDGRCTPGTFADLREMEAIQQAIVDGGGRGGVFQVAPDFATRKAEELAMFERGADLGCRILFSGGTHARGDGGVGFWREYLERNNAAGRYMRTLSHSRPSGALFGLAQALPFKGESWHALLELPDATARAAAMRAPGQRARLVAEARQAGFKWGATAHTVHPLGNGATPTFDLDRTASVAQQAEAAGVDPFEFVVDRLIASDGRELFSYWMFSGTLENQWPFLQMEHCVPALGDAGAHVGFLMDADSPTFLLSELTRDRGLFTLPEAVRRLTSYGAELLGLRERGLVQEGWHADLNVIDIERLGTCYPEYVNDFPHDGGRFIVRSTGYVATIVGGEIVVTDGAHTGQRPGVVIREFVRS